MTFRSADIQQLTVMVADILYDSVFLEYRSTITTKYMNHFDISM